MIVTSCYGCSFETIIDTVLLFGGWSLHGEGLEGWALGTLIALLGLLHCLISRLAAKARAWVRILLWLAWGGLALTSVAIAEALILKQQAPEGFSIGPAAVLVSALVIAVIASVCGIVFAPPGNTGVSGVSDGEAADGSAVPSSPPASLESLFRHIVRCHRSDFPDVILRPDDKLRTSVAALAKVLGCSRATAWRRLKALEEYGCIALQSGPHGTVITLLDHPVWRISRRVPGPVQAKRCVETAVKRPETPLRQERAVDGMRSMRWTAVVSEIEVTPAATSDLDRLAQPSAPALPVSDAIEKSAPETPRNASGTRSTHPNSDADEPNPQGTRHDEVSAAARLKASANEDTAFESDPPSNWTTGGGTEWSFNPDLRIVPFSAFAQDGKGRRANAVHHAMTALIANVAVSLQRGSNGAVHYSRDANRYCRDRYHPRWLTLGTVRKAVDRLVESGLVTENRARASPRQRHRSTIRPTLRLIEQLKPLQCCSVFVEPAELIQLRDGLKKPKDYRDTTDTIAKRHDVREHNMALAAVTVDLVDDRVDWLAPNLLRFAGELYSLGTTYRRIFNGDFKSGGRWFADIQNLPKVLRTELTIDGERTTEYDYRACHFRLLWALAKLPLDATASLTFDPFDLPGQDRRHVKRSFNILLNAASHREALLALAWELREEGVPKSHQLARHYLDLVTSTFPHFSDYWGRGFGVKLQYYEAEICSQVQRRMREHSVPIISIHDGFLAPARHAQTLETVATEIFDDACDRLRRVQADR